METDGWISNSRRCALIQDDDTYHHPEQKIYSPVHTFQKFALPHKKSCDGRVEEPTCKLQPSAQKSSVTGQAYNYCMWKW
jgi:hypothetical protein